MTKRAKLRRAQIKSGLAMTEFATKHLDFARPEPL